MKRVVMNVGGLMKHELVGGIIGVDFWRLELDEDDIIDILKKNFLRYRATKI